MKSKITILSYPETVLPPRSEAALFPSLGSDVYVDAPVTKSLFEVEVPESGYNRFTLVYSSSCAIWGRIDFSDGLGEDFFLEKGENVTFRSLIEDFAHGRVLTGDATVILTPRESGAVFSVSAIEVSHLTEDVKESTFFFESERYKVGVELAWGGGLSYLEDKKCPDKELHNMLNNFDTGRLIQQSYYGTNEPPYELGSFMGNPWHYNPVQGGDKINKKSKLVDFEIRENGIYIKCRPRDWGHKGEYTFSYMENFYCIEGDVIRVDNRFTDYSGYHHPPCHQELPAFYTVSKLGRYYYYDGDKPWQGQPLVQRDDLFFWAQDPNFHTFPVREGNTECWSAFVTEENYGIGLFTPASSILHAGRYKYNGSTDPKGESTNYIAPLCTFTLKCYQPFAYSYLLTAGTIDEIRANFTAHKDEIDNSTIAAYGN